MSDTVIRVENLSKRYVLQHQVAGNGLRHVLQEAATAPWRWLTSRGKNAEDNAPKGSAEDFWALRDLSFEIRQGDVVGIIGRNGAGKSTLLKILSRITEPSKGSIRLRGRVASLLEVGTGFHPDLTGRENIFLNGAILGMSTVEIRRKFDEIVAFAEVEKFLDTPVKRYSSGMYVRLAFAVAAHLEPEILIVDEVLAVGDSEFQKKCLGKMGEVSTKDGRTVIFVSHNLSAVRSLCTRAILLQKGQLIIDAPVDEALSFYAGDNRLASLAAFKEDPTKPSITRVEIDEAALNRGDLTVDISFTSPFELNPVVPGILISAPSGEPVYGSNPRFHPDGFELRPAKSGRVRMVANKLPLISGSYRLSVWLGDWTTDYDQKPNAVIFDFKPDRKRDHIPRFEGVGGLDWVAAWQFAGENNVDLVSGKSSSHA